MKQLVVALMVVAGALFAGAGVTHAYPPAAPTITVSDPQPPPGGNFTVTVRGCLVGERVRFKFPDPPVPGIGTSVKVVVCVGPQGSQAGTATATFTAPNQGGVFTGTAKLLRTNVTLQFQVSVDVPTYTVPKTGSDGIGRKTSMGLGLLALGGGLLLVSRRRRHAPTPAAA